MHPQNISHMLSFHYQKSSKEILDKVGPKIAELKAKVENRQSRILALRKEYGIDDAALIQLLTEARRQAKNNQAAMSFSYSTRSAPDAGMEERSIGAGVVNNLLTENDFIEAEKAQIKKLELIQRNLRPMMSGDPATNDAFSVSESDLEYLGF